MLIRDIHTILKDDVQALYEQLVVLFSLVLSLKITGNITVVYEVHTGFGAFISYRLLPLGMQNLAVLPLVLVVQTWLWVLKINNTVQKHNHNY